MYLLDTNIFYFSIYESEKLSSKIVDILQENELVYVSSVCFWELEIKQSKGKITLNKDMYEGAKILGYKTLDINTNHIKHTSKLPTIHSDPFDRMIISQAILENLTIITSDKVFSGYQNLKLLLN